MTRNGVGTICGVHDYAAILNNFYGLFDKAKLRRFWVNLKELAHGVFENKQLFILARAIVVFKLCFEYV